MAVILLGLLVALFAFSGRKAAQERRSERESNEAAAASIIHSINGAQTNYASLYPNRRFAPSLAALGPGPLQDCKHGEGSGNADHACLIDDKDLGDSRCSGATWCNKRGYRYLLSCADTKAQCNDYVVIAAPAEPNSGSFDYCATADGKLHFRTSAHENMVAITAEQCRGWNRVIG